MTDLVGNINGIEVVDVSTLLRPRLHRLCANVNSKG